MRCLRMLAALVLAAMLVILPLSALGQESGPPSTFPLALQPHGRLPLQGTPWRLEAYRFRGIERSPGPEVAARLRLRPGTFDASGGCTRFGGRYGAVGSAIHFELRGLKKNDCGEQTVMVQLAMTDGLRKAADYELVPGQGASGDRLVLLGANGQELLRFGLDDVGAIEVGEWRLESYLVDGQRTPADPGQSAVLSFRPARRNEARRVSSGPASGSTGCNGFVAEYFRRGSVMSFGELERTEAPCTPSMAAQEEAILAVLDATSQRVALAPDLLVLTSSDTGDSLALLPARPLEGSTWLLTKVSGTPAMADPVTLRLTDGAVTGEGPCGPYSASYVTDGYFITFADTDGAGDGACAAIDAEKAFLAALRSTVMVDRDQPQLRMRDARGKVVARFKSPSGP